MKTKAVKVSVETWHGIQNRFTIIEESVISFLDEEERAALAKELCAKERVDGLLVVEPLTRRRVRMILYNSDGSRAEMCGNGIRCVAAYALQRDWVKGPRFVIQTDAGLKTIEVVDGKFRVNMGPPILEPERIPVNPTSISPAGIPYVLAPIREEGWESPNTVRLDCLSMGNPHAVLILSQSAVLEEIPIEELGPKIETRDEFPERTNFEVGYFEDEDRHTVRVRVWERGVGETQRRGGGRNREGLLEIPSHRPSTWWRSRHRVGREGRCLHDRPSRKGF
jgi:diaminopimelate epimerase